MYKFICAYDCACRALDWDEKWERKRVVMEQGNTNWGQSVTGVVIKDNKVLLARHTYGGGKGMLIIPGGYVNEGETPQDALRREYREETNIEVEPGNIIGIRFNQKDWYIAFRAEYLSGDARSDHDENSEVVWMDVSEIFNREDVPELTKKLVRSALNEQEGLQQTEYHGKAEHNPSSLYCL